MNTANINYDCYLARGRALRSQAIREALLSVSGRFFKLKGTATDNVKGRAARIAETRIPDCAAAA